MEPAPVRCLSRLALSSLVLSVLFGCANYEVNTRRGGVPGYYIRSEMQEADRAIDAARNAGKDKMCPAEFKDVEAARDKAYDVFRACHTEEGAALAKQATARANALCPPQSAMKGEASPWRAPEDAATQAKGAPAGAIVVPAAEPTPDRMKYCVFLNIEYDIARADIRPEYRYEVGKVGDFMKRYPTTTAVIEGYSDEVGTDAFNLQLSQRRAEGVVKALETDYGIDPSRLTAKGYGKASPVADNATDEGRQKNRRIKAVIDCAFDVKEIATPPDRLCIGLKAEFATDSAEIRPTDYGDLDKVGDYMRRYPTTTAVIEGHTDSTGSLDHNLKLSQQRAENVVTYLVEKSGIDRTRLSAKGYGPTRRIAYDDTAEGRQKNRRINAIIDCVVQK